MARLARIVVPDIPHHVTQRGNRRQPVFFEPGDYRYYLKLLAAAAEQAETGIWAYCLMPNHVHLILTPSHADGLRATLADAHRRYTRFINDRNDWTGHLWQGRFGSVAMDEGHLAGAIRYVSLNPVRARLVKAAADWPWSSVNAHLAGKDDGVVRVKPVLDRFADFAGLLRSGEDQSLSTALRAAESTGRPLGEAAWLAALESRLGRAVMAKKRGRKSGD
ncbi:MAG: transposase [Rhodospirillales bacterium]|jgi:putative transposase|nr:transposase [Rhodospirillaceae bacterium]MDP6428045.1 transposase [Rhodospirillales bacterium]MDP6643750.1 transposase [Rhodospirillales bacterium]MDP6843208.1 transposase [Rhodospirillales bacterium]